MRERIRVVANCQRKLHGERRVMPEHQRMKNYDQKEAGVPKQEQYLRRNRKNARVLSGQRGKEV